MTELHHWRGAGADIQFDPEDFEVMELAMGVVPEVRVCALVLKWMRDANLRYPVQTVDDIVQAFPHERFVGGGHMIDPDSIRAFMAKEYFPIEHEGELLSRTYLALMRCKNELSKSNPSEAQGYS
jgi:hypothetical protein